MEVHLREKAWPFFRKFCCLWFSFILNYFKKSSRFFLIMRRSSFVACNTLFYFHEICFSKYCRFCALFVLLIPYLWMVDDCPSCTFFYLSMIEAWYLEFWHCLALTVKILGPSKQLLFLFRCGTSLFNFGNSLNRESPKMLLT